MYFPRTLERIIQDAVTTFPALVVTGPRQSGKTTLLRRLFAHTHTFIPLEDLDVRRRAAEDPRGFLDFYSPPLILDEIQYVPDLLPYIKTRIDEDRTSGQWLFTGSQIFPLMEGVSQSLAGRIAVMQLWPFNCAEQMQHGRDGASFDTVLERIQTSTGPAWWPEHGTMSPTQWVVRGGYPEPVANKAVNRQLWYSSYISTCIERDVRQLLNVGDVEIFGRFLRLCGTLAGRLLNQSSLASDCGISVPTAKRWLSVLEASGIIFFIRPYYRNFGKRLTKAPKLYFHDTGLACRLCGIHTETDLVQSYCYGRMFENAIIAELRKKWAHTSGEPFLYFLRTADGSEIDCVVAHGGRLFLFEIKSTKTLAPGHGATCLRWKKEIGKESRIGGVIAPLDHYVPVRNGVVGIPWHALA